MYLKRRDLCKLPSQLQKWKWEKSLVAFFIVLSINLRRLFYARGKLVMIFFKKKNCCFPLRQIQYILGIEVSWLGHFATLLIGICCLSSFWISRFENLLQMMMFDYSVFVINMFSCFFSDCATSWWKFDRVLRNPIQICFITKRCTIKIW